MDSASLSAASPRSRIAAIWSVVAIMGASLWRAFGGPVELSAFILAACVALIAIEFRRIPWHLRRVSLGLFAVSALLLPLARAPQEAVQRGVFVAGILVSLIGSVMLVARCALRSRQVQMLGERLRMQRPGQRYVSFTVAGQLFSAMLGFAGANIMFVMAAPPGEGPSRQRTASIVAVVRGFAAASFWSPMFGNMAILLALYPTVQWIEVFPLGVGLGQLSVLAGLILVRLRRVPAEGGSEAPLNRAQAATQTTNEEAEDTARPKLLDAALPLAAVMAGFLFLVLGASTSLGISITLAIVMTAPPLAALLNLATAPQGRRVRHAARIMREDLSRFPLLANEAMLFLAAGCAGSVMAAAFPPAWAAWLGQMLGGMPLAGIAFLMAAIIVMALIGVHPVLTAVFLASTVTPQLLQLPPVVHMAGILAGWGLSASLTPFSVTSMAAARYAGVGLFHISVGKNWGFALASAALVCLALGAGMLLTG